MGEKIFKAWKAIDTVGSRTGNKSKNVIVDAQWFNPPVDFPGRPEDGRAGRRNIMKRTAAVHFARFGGRWEWPEL
jgi:hypothetical protein